MPKFRARHVSETALAASGTRHAARLKSDTVRNGSTSV